jgi:hypothetical protein
MKNQESLSQKLNRNKKRKKKKRRKKKKKEKKKRKMKIIIIKKRQKVSDMVAIELEITRHGMSINI